MESNDDFYGKELNLNCFYMHTNFEQKYPKTAVVKGKNKSSFGWRYDRDAEVPGFILVVVQKNLKIPGLNLIWTTSICWKQQQPQVSFIHL